MSDDARQTRERYMMQWNAVLGNLLGWNEERVTRWAKRFEEGLSGRDRWFTHQHALRHMSYLLVPKSVRRRMDRLQCLMFAEQLEIALSRGNPFCGLDSHHDWEAARQAVNAILSLHDTSLDKVVQELGDDGELRWVY
jgi:hypothetical protein